MTKKKNFDPTDMENFGKQNDSEKSRTSSIGLVPADPILKDQNNSGDLWAQLNKDLGNHVGGQSSQDEKTAVLNNKGTKEDKTEILHSPLNLDSSQDKTELLVSTPGIAENDKTKLISSTENIVQGIFNGLSADASYPSVAIPALPTGESVSYQRVSGDHFQSGGNEKTLVVPEYSNQKAEQSKSKVYGFSNPVAGVKSADKKDGKRIVRTEVAVKVNSAEAALIQSENLRLAQEKIEFLEQHIEHIRAENEELAASAEIFKNMVDDLHKQIESSEKTRRENEEILMNEIQFLKESNEHKDKDLYRTKEKNADLEQRINNDLRKIRVRERELENRLELMKMEKNAIVKSKDETILELKRKLDLVEAELDNYKRKTIELGDRFDGSQDQMRRTVRALRIALNHLESGEEAPRIKKAE